MPFHLTLTLTLRRPLTQQHLSCPVPFCADEDLSVLCALCFVTRGHSAKRGGGMERSQSTTWESGEENRNKLVKAASTSKLLAKVVKNADKLVISEHHSPPSRNPSALRNDHLRKESHLTLLSYPSPGTEIQLSAKVKPLFLFVFFLFIFFFPPLAPHPPPLSTCLYNECHRLCSSTHRSCSFPGV